MLTRATRSLAPAHAACARSMHSAARLLAEATPAAASAAAAAAPSMPNLTAEATAAGFPRRLIRLADDVAAHRRPRQSEDGKWRVTKLSLTRAAAAESPLPHLPRASTRRFSTFVHPLLPPPERDFWRRVKNRIYPFTPAQVALMVTTCLAINLAAAQTLNPKAHQVQYQAGLQLRLMEEKRDKAREGARKRGQQLSLDEEAEWEEAIAPLRKRWQIAKFDWFGLYPIYVKHFGSDAQKEQEAARENCS